MVTKPSVEFIDVDQDIPACRYPNPNAVAVVIGISSYKDRDVPPVAYARRDATATKEYCVSLLGVPSGHIIELYDEDASLSAFKRVFEQQLKLWSRKRESDVYIYYSGHGAPDPETRLAYFVPWDCDPVYARSTGYPVTEMYDQLRQLGARSVTVFTDACFSGMAEQGSLLKGVSPIVPVVETPLVGIDKAAAFASAESNQLSGWYKQKKHSLFTYFLLKGLRGEADADGNRKLMFEEIERYVTEQVSEKSRFINGREQTPVMSGDKANRLLLEY
jgi:uncharacterized caspase-like protein